MKKLVPANKFSKNTTIVIIEKKVKNQINFPTRNVKFFQILWKEIITFPNYPLSPPLSEPNLFGHLAEWSNLPTLPFVFLLFFFGLNCNTRMLKMTKTIISIQELYTFYIQGAGAKNTMPISSWLFLLQNKRQAENINDFYCELSHGLLFWILKGDRRSSEIF